ncbi:MAG: hypothetical protein ACRCWQ_02715 [Bacilli bacterium]
MANRTCVMRISKRSKHGVPAEFTIRFADMLLVEGTKLSIELMETHFGHATTLFVDGNTKTTAIEYHPFKLAEIYEFRQFLNRFSREVGKHSLPHPTSCFVFSAEVFHKVVLLLASIVSDMNGKILYDDFVTKFINQDSNPEVDVDKKIKFDSVFIGTVFRFEGVAGTYVKITSEEAMSVNDDLTKGWTCKPINANIILKKID